MCSHLFLEPESECFQGGDRVETHKTFTRFNGVPRNSQGNAMEIICFNGVPRNSQRNAMDILV